mgnify:FL=1|tara:strand:+ start:111 stop:368 length:258 start_codon:yes stop_codon:yes gene_type:complete
MLMRTFLIYSLMIVAAVAFHDNTFAVFSLKEELQERYINMWELLHQLEYVTPEQRVWVYDEIEHIREEINSIIQQLMEHDRSQHP